MLRFYVGLILFLLFSGCASFDFKNARVVVKTSGKKQSKEIRIMENGKQEKKTGEKKELFKPYKVGGWNVIKVKIFDWRMQDIIDRLKKISFFKKASQTDYETVLKQDFRTAVIFIEIDGKGYLLKTPHASIGFPPNQKLNPEFKEFNTEIKHIFKVADYNTPMIVVTGKGGFRFEDRNHRK